MTEENLSKSVRKYYILRYTIIGIILLSSAIFFGTTIDNRQDLDNSDTDELQLAYLESEVFAPAEDVRKSNVISTSWIDSYGLLLGGLLVIVGITYATYTRRSVPGLIRGYVKEQTPFWHIERETQNYTIKMNGTSILVRFSPKTRSRWGALRIEFPLNMQLPSEQITLICEQNGVRYSEKDNLISTIAAPDELNWKLLIFSRIVKQINDLR